MRTSFPLGELLEQLQEGDILLISELSRLGRSLFEVMEIL
ncbi:MAG: recombinase family protein [Bacteroidota bacterium]|nr:recombinase family protein [Chitinophagaceae bacterium]QLH47308.1 MAG: recombinase family protein [Bacteroidota bacterium]